MISKRDNSYQDSNLFSVSMGDGLATEAPAIFSPSSQIGNVLTAGSEYESKFMCTPSPVNPNVAQISKSALAPNNTSGSNIGTDLTIPLPHSHATTEVVLASGCSFSSPSSMELPQINETPGLVSSLASPNDSSKPVRDLKLEAALNGQEPTVRNLIMAAIGVMKNRKVIIAQIHITLQFLEYAIE